MGVFESLIAALIGTASYDWLSVTGSAARFTSFDYAYLPLSRARLLSLLLLALAGFYLCFTINPENPPIIPPILCAIAIAFHAWIAIGDMFAQRRRARSDEQDAAGDC